MAAFNYNGTTYFYARGKWLDSQSKQVPADLEEALNNAFSKEEIMEKEAKQKLSKEKKENKTRSSVRIKHKRARVTSYRRNFSLTKDQKRAIGALESGENVFLSGEAGTGKSFVLNEYIYRNRDKDIIVCAPTGIAAINIGGSTLHRVFNVPIEVTRPGEYNAEPGDSIVKADIIIIDEISMCRYDIFEYVIRTLKRAEQIQQHKANMDAINEGRKPEMIAAKQIIVVGDFFQLAPVVTPNDRKLLAEYWDMNDYGDGFAFDSPLWKELNFKNIVLKEIVRQKGSVDYINNLNKIRKGDSSGIQWFNDNTGRIPIPNSIYLCATNRVADIINNREAAALEGEPTEYTASIKGKVQMSDKMTQDSLSLKVGMQVMTLINNVEEGYQNGSIGKIVSLGSDFVEVRLNTGKYVTVKPYDWEIYGYEVQEEKLEKIVLGNFKQLPLKIAYAITIHKSQGQTYSSANISPDCFAAGQLYVALSRVQTVEGISLEHDIRYNALKTSSEVKAFYENLIEDDEQYEIDDIPENIEDLSVNNQNIDFPKKSSIFEKVQNMSDEEASSCYMYRTIKDKPNAYSVWTDEEEKQMLEELDSGMKIADVAKKHQRTTGAIKSRLKKIRER